MNAKEIEELGRKRAFVMAGAHGMCEYPGCGAPGTEMAHTVARTKANLRKYGPEIVNHPKLLRWSCRKHNDYFNRGFRPRGWR
jgi:hypothetical protein